MSILSNLGEILTGTPGEYSGEYKDKWKDLLGQYSAMSYDPRQDVAQTMESYDTQLANQQAAGMGALGASGFGGASQFGGTRARFAAMTQAQMRRAYNDWLQKKMHGMGQMMQGAAPAFYRQPTQGIGGILGQVAASYIGKPSNPTTATSVAGDPTQYYEDDPSYYGK